MDIRRRIKAIFAFLGINGEESYCKITIYPVAEIDNVVIIAELEANQGTAAVNKIEEVVSGITQKYGLDPTKTTWIHHSPEGQGIFLGREDFHKVPIEWNGRKYVTTNQGNKWDLLSRSEVENMVGTSVDM